jgi:2-oxoglutarate ferredoxin oxidoreductase subunit gamma
VLQPDVVVVLSREAYRKFASNLKPGGLLIVDSDKVDSSASPHAVCLPITRLAFETTGKIITANTVALGVLVGLTGLVTRQSLEKAVTARAPRGTEDINLKALEAGFDAAQKVNKS